MKIPNKQDLRSRIIEQARFKYSPLGKASQKQIKNNGRSRRKTNKSE